MSWNLFYHRFQMWMMSLLKDTINMTYSDFLHRTSSKDVALFVLKYHSGQTIQPYKILDSFTHTFPQSGLYIFGEYILLEGKVFPFFLIGSPPVLGKKYTDLPNIYL